MLWKLAWRQYLLTILGDINQSPSNPIVEETTYHGTASCLMDQEQGETRYLKITGEWRVMFDLVCMYFCLGPDSGKAGGMEDLSWIVNDM